MRTTFGPDLSLIKQFNVIGIYDTKGAEKSFPWLLIITWYDKDMVIFFLKRSSSSFHCERGKGKRNQRDRLSAEKQTLGYFGVRLCILRYIH